MIQLPDIERDDEHRRAILRCNALGCDAEIEHELIPAKAGGVVAQICNLAHSLGWRIRERGNLDWCPAHRDDLEAILASADEVSSAYCECTRAVERLRTDIERAVHDECEACAKVADLLDAPFVAGRIRARGTTLPAEGTRRDRAEAAVDRTREALVAAQAAYEAAVRAELGGGSR